MTLHYFQPNAQVWEDAIRALPGRGITSIGAESTRAMDHIDPRGHPQWAEIVAKGRFMMLLEFFQDAIGNLTSHYDLEDAQKNAMDWKYTIELKPAAGANDAFNRVRKLRQLQTFSPGRFHLLMNVYSLKFAQMELEGTASTWSGWWQYTCFFTKDVRPYGAEDYPISQIHHQGSAYRDNTLDYLEEMQGCSAALNALEFDAKTSLMGTDRHIDDLMSIPADRLEALGELLATSVHCFRDVAHPRRGAELKTLHPYVECAVDDSPDSPEELAKEEERQRAMQEYMETHFHR